MSCKYICDSCGKEKKADSGFWTWMKPEKWFTRRYIDTLQDACSQECVEEMLKKFPGKKKDGE